MVTFLLPLMVACCVLSGMSTSAMSSQIKMDSSDDEPIENCTYSKSQISLAQINEYLKIDDVYGPDDIVTNYQPHHEISKRNTISSPKMGSKKRNSPVCEGKLLCIYYYPDHPDAGRSSSRIKGNSNQPITTNNGITSEKQATGSNPTVLPICEDTSSFCTYFYPDHPDAGLRRTKGNYNYSKTINTSNEQKTKGSYKTSLPLCEDSSSICTFKKKNNNYTALIADVNNQSLSNVAGTSITDHTYLLDTVCSNQSLDVRLRNSNTKEFLYAASDYWATDEEKRPTFTWKDLTDIPGISNEWDLEETWRIEPFDQVPSKSFLLRNLKTKFGPKAYMFAGNSGGFIYVRRGLSVNDSPVLTIGWSAKWRLLAKLVDQTKLREDFCDIDTRKIQGWVLMNVKYAPKCINGDENDFSEVDTSKKRGNVRIAPEGPYSYWEILPLSIYQPSSIPVSPARNWKDGPKGTKWDINCDFFEYNIADAITNLSDLECMDRCIRNYDCTHWTYTILLRNCWLKKANEMKENYFFMAKCGFVTGRSEQKY